MPSSLRSATPPSPMRSVPASAPSCCWGMAQPRYRDMFELNLTEHPNGTCDYALIIDGQTLHARRDIHDQQEIARLRQACQRMKVDDYLLSLQQHKDDAMSLIPAGEPLSIKQGKTGDCYALVVMIGALSSPIVQESILNSAEITERGALRLTFNANIHSPMGRQKVLRASLRKPWQRYWLIGLRYTT